MPGGMVRAVDDEVLPAVGSGVAVMVGDAPEAAQQPTANGRRRDGEAAGHSATGVRRGGRRGADHDLVSGPASMPRPFFG